MQNDFRPSRQTALGAQTFYQQRKITFMDGLPAPGPRVIDMPIEGGVFPHGMGDCVEKVEQNDVPLAPEKFIVTLDQQSREEIGFEARAISLDENDELRPVTEEMFSQAVNAQIHEYAAARRVLKEDYERIKALEAEVAALKAEIAERDERDYNRMVERNLRD